MAADVYRITIKIAGRNYPLNVSPSDEETLRKVGKSIEAMVKDFEANFAVKDKQDALAMCALRMGAAAEKYRIKDEENTLDSTKRLKKLNQLLENEIGNL